MTQIIKKQEQGIQSLSDKIKTELVKMKAQQGVVFLLDVSGSMSEIIDGMPKIAHLRKVMQKYPHSREISFSGRVWEGCIPLTRWRFRKVWGTVKSRSQLSPADP